MFHPALRCGTINDYMVCRILSRRLAGWQDLTYYPLFNLRCPAYSLLLNR
jgi:hypothetical protein